MLTNDVKNDNVSSPPAKKSFFGNAPLTSFFNAPSGLVQQQPAAKLPEFSTGNFVNGNLAFFDAHYQVAGPVPQTGMLFITHGVHMNYPPAMTKDERSTFENDFVKSVHEIWSNQHLLTLTEPGFSRYRCKVDVSAHVEDDPKNAHTVIDVVKPGPDEKRFRSRVSSVGKEEGSETTHKAQMDFRDPTVEKKNKIGEADLIRHVGNFDFDSDKLNADCMEDIQVIKDFIAAIPAPDDPEKCTFSLHYVGRASLQGSVEYNKKLSERRVKSVQKELDSLPGICFSFEEAAGEEEATEGAEFRRVNVGVFVSNPPKPTETTQNVAAHEFGHMIGLGDEYIETKPEIKGSRVKYFGDDPTHYDATKLIVNEEEANKLRIQDSENIMSLGNKVQRGHYVTFVAAIDIMTKPEIEQATGNKNAKWNVI